jgi:hypothetical protein
MVVAAKRGFVARLSMLGRFCLEPAQRETPSFETATMTFTTNAGPKQEDHNARQT